MRKINSYTVEDVLIANAENYESKLEKARDAYVKFEEDLDKVIDELDPDAEKDRIGELEGILSQLTEAIRRMRKKSELK